MSKGLFTSLEEITFQNAYVKGKIIPEKRQKTFCYSKKIRQAEKGAHLCAKKKNKARFNNSSFGRSR